MNDTPAKDAPEGRATLNTVYGEALSEPATLRYVAHFLPASEPYLLLGEPGETAAVAKAFAEAGRTAAVATWHWSQPLPSFAGGTVICSCAETAAHWEALAALRPARVRLLQELALRFTPLRTALRTFGSFHRPVDLDPLDQAVRWYLGLDPFGPLDAVEEVMPLRGRRIVEFGPLDGFQTAALRHQGAASVTCIEARPENALKVLAAREAFGWTNVEIVLDDFHDTSAPLRGPFDVAWAHGVYYHSIAPFVFLDSLLEMAPDVFLGGFCATDERPDGPVVVLEHRGQRYRAKQYRESGDFMAGVNTTGYFLYGADLVRFFEQAGCRVTTISDTPSTVTAGQYLRFVARR